MTVRLLPLLVPMLAAPAGGAAPASPQVAGEGAAPEAGLLGLYRAQSSSKAAPRIDPSPALLVAPGESPDARLPPGPFSVGWRGTLSVPEDSRYRFHAELQGTVHITVDGATVIEGAAQRTRVLSSAPFPLAFGPHRIEIRYRSEGGTARLGIFWEGEDLFSVEPLGARSVHLTQEDAGSEEAERARRFHRGEALALRLACGACHPLPSLPAPRRAPSLRKAFGRRPEAVVARLLSVWKTRPGSPMPDFDVPAAVAGEIAAYLTPRAGGPEGSGNSPGAEEGDAGSREAERLLALRGCLACHDYEGLGRGRFRGGSLDGVSLRRSPAGIGEFLRSGHRPPLKLTAGEVERLAAGLSGIAARAERRTDSESDLPRGNPASRGAEHLMRYRCGACHDVSGSGSAPPPVPLPRDRPIDWERSCIGSEGPAGHRPAYRNLRPDERAALREFFTAAHPHAGRSTFRSGALLLDREGCTSCHVRGESPGLGPVAHCAAQQFAHLRGLEPALVPPALDGAGGKLRREVLDEAVRGRRPVRPWLLVRMPLYEHTGGDETAITTYLVASDRVPQALAPPAPALPPGAAIEAGRKLLGASGFNCVSCHASGGRAPRDVRLAVRGPDLDVLGGRFERFWFLRWLRDPARMAPGVEMPAIRTPVPAFLGGRLDRQLEAIWIAVERGAVAGLENWRPVRLVRAGSGGRTAVIRDVFRVDPSARLGTAREGWTARGFALGFPGGGGLLLDLDLPALRLWWSGRFAEQRTEAKTWFWIAAGTELLALPPATSFLRSAPAGEGRSRSVPLALASWRHEDRARVRLEFEGSGRRKDRKVEVLLAPLAGGSPGGFSFELASRGVTGPTFALGLPANSVPRPEGAVLNAVGSRGELRFEAVHGEVWRAVEGPGGGSRTGTPLFETPLKLETGGEARAKILFKAEEPVAEGETGRAERVRRRDVPSAPPRLAERTERVQARRLDGWVPGFRAIVLPLPPTLRPTGFAFDDKGGVYMTALDGDLFRLADTDGDGIEDEAVRIADRLSAPFGLLVESDSIVVSHKPELLRLFDRDRDGYFEEGGPIAWGWGFTHDYHDWTFGLVRDRGRYVVLLGSDYQQKGRDPETIRHRGKALAVRPDGGIEVLARGLRFTVGLARKRNGALFFSDNQGEGNPFNEINHLQVGRAYGVPSREDPPDDRMGEGEPAAVWIPHPWTRSVNGIAFLEAQGRFGLFEGHGVGCEYDNRKLIRFTLERVQDRYQGACYAFSRAAPPELLAPLACGVSPHGELYVGTLHDSGWAGGDNSGRVLKLAPTDAPPQGILEVRARPRGFALEFTRDLSSGAGNPELYSVTAYRRIWEGGYSTPDRDRHAVKVTAARPRPESRTVEIELERMEPGFLYEIRVRSAVPGEALFPDTAHYTLHTVPGEAAGNTPKE